MDPSGASPSAPIALRPVGFRKQPDAGVARFLSLVTQAESRSPSGIFCFSLEIDGLVKNMKLPLSPPNQLTFLRIVLTPVFVAFLFSSNPLLRQFSLLVFIVALLTDWYDGWVARRWGYVTRWGTFLDPLADKVVTSAALISFIYLNLVPAWTVWVIVVRDIAITFLRSYSEYKGKPFDTSRLAKTKTFLQFVVIYYVLLVYIALDSEYLRNRFGELLRTLLDYSLLYGAMVVIAGITLLTGVLYIVENWKTLRELYGISGRVTESE
jgi:CDP-diacylglycerol--glycerol-3-phosphate 3-phosphatidyltransferase